MLQTALAGRRTINLTYISGDSTDAVLLLTCKTEVRVHRDTINLTFIRDGSPRLPNKLHNGPHHADLYDNAIFCRQVCLFFLETQRTNKPTAELDNHLIQLLNP